MPKDQNQKGIGQVSDTSPLYNSRIIKTYLEYIKNSNPDLDIDPMLEYAGMTRPRSRRSGTLVHPGSNGSFSGNT